MICRFFLYPELNNDKFCHVDDFVFRFLVQNICKFESFFCSLVLASTRLSLNMLNAHKLSQ